MNYTYQECSNSGSFSPPNGTNVSHATSKRQLVRALEYWQAWHNRVGSDEREASLLVWEGTLDDVTDIYPDFEVKTGPRMGVTFTRC